MAEGGGGEAGEEEPRAAGPRPPSARDLQVRRAVRRGNVWGRSGRGRASQTRPGASGETSVGAPRSQVSRRRFPSTPLAF